MSPGGMLINKYLKKRDAKRDAERLKRQREREAREQQLAREREAREQQEARAREARQLRLSARENLYKQRVNAGTANAFERRIAAGGGFKNFTPEQIKADLEKHKKEVTDQNMLDGHTAIIDSTEQTAIKNIKEGDPASTLTGEQFEKQMVRRELGWGSWLMNRLEHLNINDKWHDPQKFKWYSHEDKKTYTHFGPYVMMEKVKEVGALANLEARSPGTTGIYIYKWIPMAKKFLADLEKDNDDLIARAGGPKLPRLPEFFGKYNDAYRNSIKNALAAVNNFEQNYNARSNKQATESIIDMTQDMGTRLVSVKSTDGKVKTYDYKSLLAKVKEKNSRISEEAANSRVRKLVALGGTIDESKLIIPTPNQANRTQSKNQKKTSTQSGNSSGNSIQRPDVVSEVDWAMLDNNAKRVMDLLYNPDRKVTLGWINTTVTINDITPTNVNTGRN